MNGWLKLGLYFGAGVVTGVAATVLLSRNSADVKNALAKTVSYGMDIKDKAATCVETAKESLDDIAAEAKHAKEQRNQTTAKA